MHKDESVAQGREFVEAYVAYTHYVERLHQDAIAQARMVNTLNMVRSKKTISLYMS